MRVISRARLGKCLERGELRRVLRPVDHDIARTLEVAPVDLNIAAQKHAGATLAPASIERDVPLRCPIPGIGDPFGHRGLGQPVLDACPTGQIQTTCDSGACIRWPGVH